MVQASKNQTVGDLLIKTSINSVLIFNTWILVTRHGIKYCDQRTLTPNKIVAFIIFLFFLNSISYMHVSLLFFSGRYFLDIFMVSCFIFYLLSLKLNVYHFSIFSWNFCQLLSVTYHLSYKSDEDTSVSFVLDVRRINRSSFTSQIVLCPKDVLSFESPRLNPEQRCYFRAW